MTDSICSGFWTEEVGSVSFPSLSHGVFILLQGLWKEAGGYFGPSWYSTQGCMCPACLRWIDFQRSVVFCNTIHECTRVF